MNSNNSRKRILLVDDEEDIVKLLSRRLQSWDYGILSATNGEVALRIAEREQPHLILLDIVMPGMNGREVCIRLKTNPKTLGIPVIFLTALGMPEQIESGFNVGVQDYIVKPFDPVEMRERIEDCLAPSSPICLNL